MLEKRCNTHLNMIQITPLKSQSTAIRRKLLARLLQLRSSRCLFLKISHQMAIMKFVQAQQRALLSRREPLQSSSSQSNLFDKQTRVKSLPQRLLVQLSSSRGKLCLKAASLSIRSCFTSYVRIQRQELIPTGHLAE